MHARIGWLVVGLGLVGCAPSETADGCCVVCEDEAGDDDGVAVDDPDTDAPDDEGEDPDEVDPEDLDRCDAGEPTWCATWWQAAARGAVSLRHDSNGVVRARVDSLDAGRTCVDGDLPFWAGTGVQDGFVDPALLDEGLVLEPGESLDLVPQVDWWCVEEDEPTQTWTELEAWGERVPDRLAELVAPGADTDGDGVPDREQLEADGTTRAQHSVWEAVATEPLLTVGKTASGVAGAVEVRLTTRNLGRVAGDWTLEDRVPPGWLVTDAQPAPVERLGSAETGWILRWEGRTGSRGGHVLTYTLEHASGLDRVYVELPPADLDGPDQHTSSHPAAVYHLDVDGDGDVDCR